MGALTETAQHYLHLRRALGYELEEPGKLVLSFAAHLDGLGIMHVTADAAAEWATTPRDAAPYWHWLRMSAVRGFAIISTRSIPGTRSRRRTCCRASTRARHRTCSATTRSPR